MLEVALMVLLPVPSESVLSLKQKCVDCNVTMIVDQCTVDLQYCCWGMLPSTLK
jgi:hypothetical protein